MNGAEYLAAARQCATENQFNRLHIDLENVLAPPEFAVLWRLRRQPDVPPPSQLWLRQMRHLNPLMVRAPQSFARRSVLDRAVLYEDKSVERARKGILLAFCGSTDRLGVPMAAFLQCVDSRQWDVLRVTRERGRSYLQGWSAGPRTFPDLVDAVATAGAVRDYGRLACIGASSGGLAAALAAHLLGAYLAVAVGARGPDPAEEIAAVIERSRARPDVLFVHGALNWMDAAAAAALRDIVGGEVIPIAGVRRHNLIYHYLKLSLLPTFLQDAFARSRPQSEPS